MVSIRKAKQGFQLRKRGGGGIRGIASGLLENDWTKEDREKLGLLAVGVTIGFLCVVVFLGVFGGGSSDITTSSGAGAAAELNKIRGTSTKPHPQLRDSSRPMSDTMNALALDIYETLDCENLFNKTLTMASSSLNNNRRNNYDYSSPDFLDEAEEGNNNNNIVDDWKRDRRRRLEEEQQHGDDGGFDFHNNNNNNNNMNENSKTDDGEDWGKDAEAVQAANTDDKWGQAAQQQQQFGDDKFGGGAGGDDGFFGNEGGGGVGGGPEDDGYYNSDYMSINGRHLFCLAASPDAPEKISSSVKCDASGVKRKTLLDLWSAARAQISDTSILTRVLDVALERSDEYLMGKQYNLWAPQGDEGIEYVLNTLNSDKDADNGGLLGLSESLGPGKLFVDTGSCLGLTTLAVSGKYPGTQIVSIEPASPNWLLQEMNLRCNLDHNEFNNIKVVLAGVGPNDNDEDNMMAKLLWRSKSTTSARAWTPASELENQDTNDIELVVRLRKLKSVLAEADVYGPHTINVLNMDCSGCEYNLIPGLTEDEFDAIPTVMGGVHWGYIPTSKLPSSARAKTTHERLCKHENVAKRTKECCAFPDMPVQSSVPGEILVQDGQDGAGSGGLDKPSTVMDVIMDGLCDNFATWAVEKHLYDIKDDWGWFELTSHAN